MGKNLLKPHFRISGGMKYERVSYIRYFRLDYVRFQFSSKFAVLPKGSCTPPPYKTPWGHLIDNLKHQKVVQKVLQSAFWCVILVPEVFLVIVSVFCHFGCVWVLMVFIYKSENFLRRCPPPPTEVEPNHQYPNTSNIPKDTYYN